MDYLRLFDNKQDYSNEMEGNIKMDFPNVSLVLDGESVVFNADAIREVYFNVTSESNKTLIGDYRMFSEIYLNDDTTNLVPQLVEDSFTIDANDLVKVNETTWRNTNPKKFNSTYVNSFIVSCDEEILDDYYIGFSGFLAYDVSEGILMRDITIKGTLNELFHLPTLKENARINSNTIDLTFYFTMVAGFVSSLNVVIFKPNENGELIPITTKNSYAANIIEEKTYDVSETQLLEDFFLTDFTLKCEEDILPTDTLFTYENNEIVPLYTIEEFLTYANSEGLYVDLIDSKTLAPVNGYFPRKNYVKLYGIMRDGVVLTQKVNIVGIARSEFGNDSISTDKLGENKIQFKITNRLRTPVFWGSNLTRLNDRALKYNKVITPNAFAGCTNLTSITIPDSVTTIGYGAFSYCNGLTSVDISDSVTTIGDWAFDSCTSLTSITIPDSITTMGGGVFNGCNILKAFYGEYASEDNRCLVVDGVLKGFAPAELTECNIPDGVTSIEDYTFRNCVNLTSVTIPDGVTSIGKEAFYSCTNLTSVNIPDSVTSIDPGAFYGCGSLTSITIPDGVTTIGDNTFAACNSLSSVIIPDGVTSIGNEAFDSCAGLTSVTIPNSVTSIGNNAFNHCVSLPSVVIPNNVTSIGELAFYNCTGLTSIIIPDSVTSIGRSAFYGCSGLTSVTIGNGVTTIGDDVFKNCSSLAAFYGKYATADNRCLVVDGILKCVAPVGLTEYTIPDGVTSIGNYAFSGCKNLTSITIPDSVTSIGEWAFYGCNSLTNVTIGDGVTTIGERAFSSCTSLTDVTIGNNVTTIGTYAFYYCTKLTSVDIPDSVTSIGDDAFAACNSLSSVTIGDGVTTIGDSVFYNCVNLTSVTMGNSVTSIGDSAFEKCSGLTSVTIPDGVTTIGKEAFYGCTKLTSVNIPDGVTTIGDYAFYGCTVLANITIPDSMTTIGKSVFYNCKGIKSITIPNSITTIGEQAFYSGGLTSVTIGNGVTSVGSKAFANCSSLKTITCLATTAPSLVGDTFSNVARRNGVLKVPTGSDYSTWKSVLPSIWTLEYI